MTLCHTGATRIYTPVPRTSNKHNSNRSRAWKRASFVLRHPCPPLTYLWKPWSHGSFQTAFTPTPTSPYTHAHVSAHTLTNQSTVSHRGTCSSRLCQPSKLCLLPKYGIESLESRANKHHSHRINCHINGLLGNVCAARKQNNLINYNHAKDINWNPNMALPSRSSGLVRSITLWPIFPSSPSLPRWCPRLSKCALSYRGNTNSQEHEQAHIHRFLQW